MSAYLQGLPAHIHCPDTLAKRCWGSLAALAPVFLVFAALGKIEALRIFLLSVVSAVAFEFLGAKLFQKKEKVQNGEAALIAALFSLLLPQDCPSEVIVFGVFFAIFIARDLFGGTGSYLFHPVLAAIVFSEASFPKIFFEQAVILNPSTAKWIFGALLISSLILLSQKKIYWETPALYILAYFFCCALWGLPLDPVLLCNAVFFTAFFLLENPVAMPLSRRGTRIFALGAAFLSFSLSRTAGPLAAAAYAVLLMNLLTPWLDVWLKPVPYKTKQRLKTTYS